MVIKFLLILLGVIVFIFIVIPLLIILISVIVSAKYDYIWEKTENGWEMQPVFHPCGEPIDEEFIKLWHERENEYNEWRKNNK